MNIGISTRAKRAATSQTQKPARGALRISAGVAGLSSGPTDEEIAAVFDKTNWEPGATCDEAARLGLGYKRFSPTAIANLSRYFVACDITCTSHLSRVELSRLLQKLGFSETRKQLYTVYGLIKLI